MFVWQIDDIIDAGAQDTDMVEEILDNLNNITQASTDGDNIIAPGDLNATITALDELSHARFDVNAAVSYDEVQVWTLMFVFLCSE